MKNLFAFILCLCCFQVCRAQQPIEKTNVILDKIYERYNAIVDSNTNAETRIGAYTAYQRKKVLATGQYKNGKRAGLWHFYNRDGKEMQQFDYDNQKLIFEAPDNATTFISYRMDYNITDKDKVTKPVIIGGRYFGYLPYIKLMRRIHDLRGLNTEEYYVVLRLQISPLGRLADCSVDLFYKPTNQKATYYINTDLLAESDRDFIPGTYNGQPVSSIIEILCQPDDAGEINLLQAK